MKLTQVLRFISLLVSFGRHRQTEAFSIVLGILLYMCGQG